jgi:transposase
MANRRFEMHQYRQVIHQMRSGQSDRAIAKGGLMGRLKCALVRTVASDNGWLEDSPLPEDLELARFFHNEQGANPTHVSLSEPHKPIIQAWVLKGLSSTVIHRQLVQQYGFTGSYSSIRRCVKHMRNAHPEASCVLEFDPAEAAQVDFGAGPTITDVFTGAVIKTWIFVMTLCFSRHQYAEIVTDQKVATWLGCHTRALAWFGGVVGKIIIDNPKCAIARACYHDPAVQRSYGEFAEGYGFIISPCPPRDPKKKGRVESGVKYVKNNFVPLRQFRTVSDANRQLQDWVMQTAGNRIHGTTHQRPLSLFAECEKNLLKPLPDVPVELAVWAKAKLHGNCHVQLEKCYYSAPYRLVHQTLWLKATETTVKIYHQLELVAVHRRLYRAGQRSTIDEHYPPEAIAYKMQDPQWCLKQAEDIGPACHRFVRRLFSHRVLDNLRAAQGIIQLGTRYGVTRLEAACTRALHFDNIKYRAVKSILNQGLDQVPLYEADNVIALAPAYTGSGRFQREGKRS